MMTQVHEIFIKSAEVLYRFWLIFLKLAHA